MPVQAQDLPAGIDASFNVASIDPTIAFSKADAVVRLDNQQFEVKSRNKAVWRQHHAITIFNDEGAEHGLIGYGYDKFRRPKKLEGQIRNAEGKVIRKLKKGDIEDYSAVSDISLYDDNRVRIARLENSTYPYTIEYWYEIEFNGYISWPSWEPEATGLSVEYSRFEVLAPADMNVRYKVEGENLDTQIIPRGKQKAYRWEVAGLRKEADDLLAALSIEFVPSGEEVRVAVAPETFEIDGAVGDMRTWASFGAWYYDLNQGRDVLPGIKEAEVRRLVNGVNDVREKVKRIYEYFQQSTRYVSIQLGIGGWQTFDANYVAERGYGDCKALTNYLKSLLGAAGIASQPVLIESDRSGSSVEKDFPNNAFNHVILMVPASPDTLWLEATSQSIPFGRIGASNEDRYALAVSSMGGQLVRTPSSSAPTNTLRRNAIVTLAASGDAVADLNMHYRGNKQDYLIHALVGAAYKDQLEWLHHTLEVPSFDVQQADFTGIEARRSETSIAATLDLPRYASRTGSRLFLNTNLFDRQRYLPPEDENRRNPVKYAYAYVDEDEVSFQLPAGYKIEAMPEDVVLETSFATYSAKHELDGTVLKYVRRLAFKQKEIEAALYNSYRDFMYAVAQSGRAQVVLVQE